MLTSKHWLLHKQLRNNNSKSFWMLSLHGGTFDKKELLCMLFNILGQPSIFLFKKIKACWRSFLKTYLFKTALNKKVGCFEQIFDASILILGSRFQTIQLSLFWDEILDIHETLPIESFSMVSAFPFLFTNIVNISFLNIP